MARASKEEELARHVYTELQAVSCPLVEDLFLQETDSMLQLLCSPSQHRTDILAWICSSINPNFGNSKARSVRSKDPEVLTKDIALLGQELMLCRAGDLDLIRGDARPLRQLQFLEQLLISVPGCTKPAGERTEAETFLNEIFSAENLPLLTQILEPSFNPWPSHKKTLRKKPKSSSKVNREEATDVSVFFQQTQSALEQLKSECDFLNDEAQSPAVFSPSSLRVAACDLQQLMSTFSHVYESDLRSYCCRDPPSFSSETDIFQRVHQLLLAFITEIEMIKEVSEASVSMRTEVNQQQTQPRYWSRGEKRTLDHQLGELKGQIKDFTSLLALQPAD
ncbi:HAUS augmin-like complex subunit 7 [Notolabrus celidotus]|uniref:HAUS augmin-like complex subunit 7 n=1 Tax=Notolabrus celidotus TaxID=1203425 RepID=UPI00148F987C|nr:HAUS augmin-like complex subunit 7 [Notolabrus celidotus]